MSLTNTDPKKTQYYPQFSWPRITNPKLKFHKGNVTEEDLKHVIEQEQKAVQEIKDALKNNPDDIAAVCEHIPHTQQPLAQLNGSSSLPRKRRRFTHAFSDPSLSLQLIIETMQGEGGDNHFRPEFLHELRKLANENEFLLIFDEVQAGFGTSGKWWAFEHFGVTPDIFVFGKKSQVPKKHDRCCSDACVVVGSTRMAEIRCENGVVVSECEQFAIAMKRLNGTKQSDCFL